MATRDIAAFFLDSSNWQHVHSKTRPQIFKKDGGPIKNLDPYPVPIVIDSPFVIVKIVSEIGTVKSWRYAGRVYQAFDNPVEVDGFYSNNLLDSYKDCQLNYPNLIYFDFFNEYAYKLLYFPPRWFSDYSIGVWKFKSTRRVNGQVVNNYNYVADAIYEIMDKVNNFGSINTTNLESELGMVETRLTLQMENKASFLYNVIRAMFSNGQLPNYGGGGSDPFGGP